MNRILLSLCMAVLLNTVSLRADDVTADQLKLTLPPAIYAVPETEIGVYFQNIVLFEPASELQFDVACEVGRAEADRWVIQSEVGETGQYPLTVTVNDAEGKPIASAETTVTIVSRDAGDGEEVRLLIVGDSLTHASVYPNRLHELLSRPANPEVTLLGTHHPAGAQDDVFHEGYGGWAWQTFLTRYIPEDKSDGTYRTRSSPFVFLNVEEKPELNLERYVAEQCRGDAPDMVIFKLGINDCFGADAEAPDARIDEVLKHADELIAAFRTVAPEATIGICLTTPGNSRDLAFDANYKGKYTRRGWKQIQHRVVERYIEHFQNRESEKISVIPTELNLDITAGYPVDNAVHPNKTGYEQIGDSIYAWLKYELDEGLIK